MCIFLPNICRCASNTDEENAGAATASAPGRGEDYFPPEFFVLPSTVEIRPSPKTNFGLFATADFSEGDVIYTNYLTAWEEHFPAHITFIIRGVEYTHSRLIHPSSENGALLYSGWEGFINHSCDPNSYSPAIGLQHIALRPISTGEEITIDYNTYSWDFGLIEPIQTCHCGVPSCLSTNYGLPIRGMQHVPRERQALKRQLCIDLVKQKIDEIFTGLKR